MTRPSRSTLAAVLAALTLSACGGGDGYEPEIVAVTVSVSVSALTVGDSGRAIATDEGLSTIPVRWISSDTAVVRVDANGTFHGIREGSAILTAVSRARPDRSAAVAITVRGLFYACPIEPGTALVTIEVGRSTDLRTAVPATTSCPGGPVSGPYEWRWRSADSTIASVTADGVVTGRRPGVTTLIVTSGRWPNIQMALHVTVTAPVCTSACPTVTPEASALLPGGGEQLEIAGVVGDSARAREYTFSSGNVAVASVSTTGFVRALAPGTAMVAVIRRSDGAVVAQVAVVVRERFLFRATIQSIVRADDGRPVHPDSVAGEIIVNVNVERSPGAARTVRLSLIGAAGDSLTASAAVPSSDTTTAIDVASFRVDTGARDASGRLRLRNGQYLLHLAFFEGVPAVGVATLHTALTLRNAP